MALTARQLNRTTLARQMLLRREQVGVRDAVRRIFAIQAQEAASVYVALWNRIAGFAASDLDAALASGSVVRGSSLRITIHALDAEEHPVVHEAMQGPLRASRLNDRRFRDTGLGIEDADALVPGLVAFLDRPRSTDEVMGWIGDQLGARTHERVWWALRTYAPVVQAPTGGDWGYGARTDYIAAPDGERPDRAEALRRLVWRYLEAFGPASERDFGQFSILRRPDVGPAFEALRSDLVVHEGPEGEVLYDVPGAEVASGDETSTPRLLGMWDSPLLAYVDRSRILPEEYRGFVIRRNGDVLPTLLVDGSVAGVWRPTDDGVELRSFRTLSPAEWEGLAEEARSLIAMIEGRRLGGAYRRNDTWWAEMPTDGEARLISA